MAGADEVGRGNVMEEGGLDQGDLLDVVRGPLEQMLVHEHSEALA